MDDSETSHMEMSRSKLQPWEKRSKVSLKMKILGQR